MLKHTINPRVSLAMLSVVLLTIMLVIGLLSYRDAGRLFESNVVFVAPLYVDDALFFSQTEIERLRAIHPAYEISAISKDSTVISSQTMQVRATVFYTSSTFYNTHFMEIIEGSTPQDYTNSILLSESLAWRLFGGFNVTGVTLWVFNEPFVVSGVARENNANYAAWLPSSFAPNMLVQSFYIRFPFHCIASVHAVPREMLSSRNHEEYLILDIHRFSEAIGIRYRLVLYAIWLMVLVWAIFRLIKIASQIKEVRPNKREFAKHALIAGFAILSVYVLYTGATNIIYALPNLSDAHTSLTGFFFGWVNMPPEEFVSANLIRLMELNARANAAFFGGLASVAILTTTQIKQVQF